MAETWFTEMRRYVRLSKDDEATLAAFGPLVAPHFRRIAVTFYDRLHEHDDARKVFSGPAQVERLKGTLARWMDQLFLGPWDDAYYEQRARIGRMHVQIGLPQRYMFGAMNLLRLELTAIVEEVLADDPERRARTERAIAKVLDLELGIMLETYGEAMVEKTEQYERREKTLLEERLALSEARYGEIVEKSELLVVTVDAAGHIVLFNRRAEEATGISRNDAVGRPWTMLFAAQDGETIQARKAEVLARGRALPYEGLFRAASGVERRIRWHFTTLPSSAGPLLCAMGLDVTDEHDLAVRSQRSERLAALGTMAAGLAHEIRNPLNAAHLQLTLLQRKLGRPTGADIDGALGAADLAASEIKRLAALVDEFLQFARPQPLRPTRGDLRSTANVIVSLLAPEAATRGVQLGVEDGRPVMAEYDDERLKQVIVNLVRNAIDATGRGGHVRVGVRRVDHHAELEVEDDGRGLPSPDAPIFEPFFTTKEDGTGLGLAIVHQIVTSHGGRVGVESRPGRTLFRVSLPLVGE